MRNETTASQPKSIGDDAQFCELLRDYMRAFNCDWTPTAEVDEKHQKFIAYIDSRAPAAQAAATIQAAPDALTTLCDKLMAMKRRLRHIPDSGQRESYLVADDVYCYVEEARRAAAIQEPVMVAEPVGVVLQARSPLGDPWQEVDADNFYKAQANGYETRVLHLAAPMVADPAGMTPEIIQWRNIQKVVAAVADFCFGSKDDPVYGASHCAVTTCLAAKDGVQVALEPLAATVNAVLSEALTGASAELLWVEVNLAAVTANKAFGQWMPERWLQEFVKAYNFEVRATKGLHAAPLADKTGGAQ